MEFAKKINNFSSISDYANYSIIYIGNEYCARLLPTEEEFKKYINQKVKFQGKFTIQTPQANCADVQLIKKFINNSMKYLNVTEIVVNDLGIMEYVANEVPELEIILGTLYPRNILSWQSETEFYSIKRIKRQEIFNFNRYTRNKAKLNVTYHFPFVTLSVSKYCPMANIASNISSNSGIISCSKDCLGIGRLPVKNNNIDPILYLEGNRLMMKSDVENEDDVKKLLAKERLIDRVVNNY